MTKTKIIVISRSYLLKCVFLLSAAIAFPDIASAASCNGVETSIDYGCDKLNTDGISAILMYAINFMAVGVGIAVVGGIIWGGVTYARANGNQATAKQGMDAVRNAIIGLMLFIFLYAIMNFLIPGGAFNLNGPIAMPGAGSSSGTNNPSTPGGSSGSANGKSGSSTKVTALSWNVYYKNSQDVGARVKQLLGSGDIIGLQEARRPAASIAKIACATCDYGVYPTASSGPARANAIVWDKTRFSIVSKGAFYTVTDVDSRYIVWGKFKDIKTEKSFYFVNTHAPVSALNGNEWDTTKPKQVAAYKSHMDRLTSFLKSKKAEGLPILVTGDFNTNYRWDKCNQAKLPCVALGKNLSIHSSYKYTNLSGIGRGESTHGNDSVLYDYVFSWQRSDVTVGANSIIGSGNGWGGSDHKPISFTVTMTTAK